MCVRVRACMVCGPKCLPLSSLASTKKCPIPSCLWLSADQSAACLVPAARPLSATGSSLGCSEYIPLSLHQDAGRSLRTACGYFRRSAYTPAQTFLLTFSAGWRGGTQCLTHSLDSLSRKWVTGLAFEFLRRVAPFPSPPNVCPGVTQGSRSPSQQRLDVSALVSCPCFLAFPISGSR